MKKLAPSSLAVAAFIVAAFIVACQRQEDAGYLPGAWYCIGALDGGATSSNLFVIEQSGSSVSLGGDTFGDGGSDVSVSCTSSGSGHAYSCPLAPGLTATFTLDGSPVTLSVTLSGCISQEQPAPDGGSVMTTPDAGCSQPIRLVMECSEAGNH